MRNREPEGDLEEPGGPGPFWSGTITFGLVSVPVNLYPAHRPAQVPLRMLAPDGTPVARHYRCEKDGREVPADHLVRGFEVEPDKHVVVSDDELDRLAPQKTRDIELRRFVDVAQLDPVRFDRPYFLTPGAGSTKAYRLLARVMERMNRAGIATFVMNGKEHIVAILAEEGILRAETLRFADEVRSPKEVGLPAPRRDVDRAQVGSFQKAIAARAKSSLATKELEDPHLQRLSKLIDSKKRRGKRVREPKAEGAEPIDLVEILRKSLAGKPAGPRKGGGPHARAPRA